MQFQDKFKLELEQQSIELYSSILTKLHEDTATEEPLPLLQTLKPLLEEIYKLHQSPSNETAQHRLTSVNTLLASVANRSNQDHQQLQQIINTFTSQNDTSLASSNIFNQGTKKNVTEQFTETKMTQVM